MEGKKAFGVETALGKALAEADALEAVRACATKPDFRALLAGIASKVPPALVETYLESIPDAEWAKARAKLLLGIKLAQGKVQQAQDHTAGRGVRKG